MATKKQLLELARERGARVEHIIRGAVRYRARAELAGRPFENVTVDIGFSDALGWKPEDLQGSDLLSFAGIDPVKVPIIPLEQHVAEKVHAYTRSYGDGRQSSRVKDLVDLVLIKQSMALDARRLRAALIGVFDARGQQALPSNLRGPPRDWGVAFRKLADEVGIDPDLKVGHAEAVALLSKTRSDARWPIFVSNFWKPRSAPSSDPSLFRRAPKKRTSRPSTTTACSRSTCLRRRKRSPL